MSLATYRITESQIDPLGARRHARRRAVSAAMDDLDEAEGKLRTQAGRDHAALRRLVLERMPVDLEDLMLGSGHPPEAFQRVADELVATGYATRTWDGWLMPTSRLEPC